MKKVFLCFVFFFASAIAVFSTFAIIELNSSAERSELYSTAMEEYREAIENLPDSAKKVERMKDEIKSEDDYAAVEKAVKQYLYDVYMPFGEARAVQSKGIYKTGISLELLKKDAPEFSESYASINSMQAKLDDVRAVSDKLFNYEAAAEYLTEELDKKYVSLFKEEVEKTCKNTALKQEYVDYADHMGSITSHYRAIIDFLGENSTNWYVEDEGITFKTTRLSDQFNTLKSELEALKKH